MGLHLGIVWFWFGRFELGAGCLFWFIGFSDLRFGGGYCTSLVWWFIRGAGCWWLVCWVLLSCRLVCLFVGLFYCLCWCVVGFWL